MKLYVHSSFQLVSKVFLERYDFTYYSNLNFMPPFGADAPLTPKGGKHLFIMRFSSFSLWGKDVRRTGWGLFK